MLMVPRERDEPIDSLGIGRSGSALLANGAVYAYLGTSPEAQVLVGLNRAGSAKPIQIAVDDLPVAAGSRLPPFSKETPDVTVSGGKIGIDQPGEIGSYWRELK